MNFTPCTNPFAYDPPARKKRRTQIRPNNDVKSMLTEFANSPFECVHVNSAEYATPANCEYTLHAGIKRHGFSDELGASMVNGEIMLYKLDKSDPTKVKHNKNKGRPRTTNLA